MCLLALTYFPWCGWHAGNAGQGCSSDLSDAVSLWLTRAFERCSSEKERANLQKCVKCEHKEKCVRFPLYFAPCKAAVRKPVLFMRGKFTASGSANVGRG